MDHVRGLVSLLRRAEAAHISAYVPCCAAMKSHAMSKEQYGSMLTITICTYVRLSLLLELCRKYEAANVAGDIGSTLTCQPR